MIIVKVHVHQDACHHVVHVPMAVNQVVEKHVVLGVLIHVEHAVVVLDVLDVLGVVLDVLGVAIVLLDVLGVVVVVVAVADVLVHVVPVLDVVDVLEDVHNHAEVHVSLDVLHGVLHVVPNVVIIAKDVMVVVVNAEEAVHLVVMEIALLTVQDVLINV